ncbi:MAG TPA: hypothetical protein VK176_05055, partial [Phycisphaerales bacterium]|nr:hypothetical protein [Phycisphaerales bacterium]
ERTACVPRNDLTDLHHDHAPTAEPFPRRSPSRATTADSGEIVVSTDIVPLYISPGKSVRTPTKKFH